MSSSKTGLIIATLVATNAFTLAALVLRDPPSPPSVPSHGDDRRLAAIEAALERLAAREPTRDATIASAKGTATGSVEDDATILARLEALTDGLARLERAVESSVRTPAESVAPPPDFTADDGFLAADRLLEEKRFASAAEGFLSFLDHHPDHPDRRALLDRARDALVKAGYIDRAIDLQRALIEEYPEESGKNLSTLARMYFEDKRYPEAVTALDESLPFAANRESELWTRMYRAWYVEFASGPEASITAYQETERLRSEYGVENPKMADKINGSIARLERQIAER